MQMLPTLSRVKLDGLIQKEQEARDAVGAVTRRLSDLGRALATAPSSEAAAIEKELTRLRDRQTDLAARHRNFADLSAAIMHWLSNIKGGLDYVKPAKAALQKGESMSAAILRLRERINALTKERVRVLQAGVPTADLKEQAIAYVDALAERGAPRLVIDHRKDFEAVFYSADTWEDAGLAAQIPRILAWLDPAALKKRLVESIDKLPQPTLALSGKARAQKLLGVEAELLEFERAEDALISAAEEGEGPVILRRLNADPRAILCVASSRGPAVKTEAKAERVA